MPSDACGGAYSCDPTLPEPGDCQSNQYTLTPFDTRIYDLHGNLTAIIAPTVEPPASPAAPDDAPKNRYLSFDPQNAGEPVAFRVEMTANTYFPDAVGMVKWVGNDGDDGAVDGYYPLGSTPVIRVWDEPVIHVYDCAIGPESTFEIRAYNEISISEPFEVNTCARPGVKYWGDCVGSFVEGQWMAPEGNLSMNDLMACLQAFANNPCAPPDEWVDVHNDGPNRIVNMSDVLLLVQAFGGEPYPYDPGTASAPCGEAAAASATAASTCPSMRALLTYDFHNQMVRYEDLRTGRTHQYLYDALGRRIAKITDALGAHRKEVRYFYDGWRVIEEQDETGATLATYVYGDYIDEVLSMRRDVNGDGTPEDYFFHTDDMYNVVAVTDASGVVVERYEYGDFGRPEYLDHNGQPTYAQVSAIGNPYLFTGRRIDPETGLYYYRTRYLDPIAGRFTVRDRIGIWTDPLELGNGYSYVGNDPWVMLDPYGLGPLDWFITGYWDPPEGVYDAALDEFARSNSDRTQGTADAIASEVTAGLIDSVGGTTFDSDNRDAAASTAGGIITAAGTAIGVAGAAKAISKQGVKTFIKGAKEGAEEGVENASKRVRTFVDDMSPDEAKRYEKYWKKRAPDQSSPYSTRRRYTKDGRTKQVTTYDKHGNRHKQYDDLHGTGRRHPHQHDSDYDSQHPRPDGQRSGNHDPIGTINWPC